MKVLKILSFALLIFAFGNATAHSNSYGVTFVANQGFSMVLQAPTACTDTIAVAGEKGQQISNPFNQRLHFPLGISWKVIDDKGCELDGNGCPCPLNFNIMDDRTGQSIAKLTMIASPQGGRYIGFEGTPLDSIPMSCNIFDSNSSAFCRIETIHE
jgi:hypothetical protein